MSMTLNMSMTLSRPSLSHESLHHRPVTFVRHRHSPHSVSAVIRQDTTTNRHCHRPLSVSAAIGQDTTTIRQDTTTWTPAPLSEVSLAGERLFYVNVDLAKSPDLVADFVNPGQYVQIRIPPAHVNPPPPPAYFYIASPVGPKSEFQFLVKSVPGKTAGVLCTLKKGDVIELRGIDGSGFDMDQLLPPQDYPTVLLFTTGYGIGPVRSLIKTGFSANKRSDVRLYYGVENLKKMAYQDEFKDWEASGVKVIPVLSDPPPHWNGATGHVQDVYLKDNPNFDPRTTGAVLSGNPDMIQGATVALEAMGVLPEKILVA